MPKSSYEDENGVFLNNFDIKDAKELRDVEYQITARQARAWEVRPRDKEFGFGLVRLKAIHRHLMGEIYPWAGKIRTVTSRKRGPFKNVTNFTAPENIDADWKMLEQKISKFLESNQTDVDENVKELTDIFVQANQIHPFPDGNGRSLQSFMQDLAREKDIDLDYANVSREEWNQACSVSGVHGKLFEGNIFIKSESDDTKIKTIFKKIAKQISYEDQQQYNVKNKTVEPDAVPHPSIELPSNIDIVSEDEIGDDDVNTSIAEPLKPF